MQRDEFIFKLAPYPNSYLTKELPSETREQLFPFSHPSRGFYLITFVLCLLSFVFFLPPFPFFLLLLSFVFLSQSSSSVPVFCLLNGLLSSVSGHRSSVFCLRSPVFCLLSSIFGHLSSVFGLLSSVFFCLPIAQPHQSQ